MPSLWPATTMLTLRCLENPLKKTSLPPASGPRRSLRPPRRPAAFPCGGRASDRYNTAGVRFCRRFCPFGALVSTGKRAEWMEWLKKRAAGGVVEPDPESPITRELVESARKGDCHAFGVLAERCRERLTSLIRLRLGSQLRRRVEEDDVLQEAYLKAYRSIARFQWNGEGSFFRWLGGIAEHVVQDLVRHHLQTQKRMVGRERSLEGALESPDGEPRELPAALAAELTPPSRRMRRDERFDRLEEAIECLDPDHREVILLAVVRGLPTKEVASSMGRSPDAVSMLLLRALRKLRARF